MTQSTIEVEPARPFAGKPAWRARYKTPQGWRYVVNAAGGIILYASREAAQLAATTAQGGAHLKRLQCKNEN